LPAGAPQYSEAFKPPEDFAYANWLVGSQTIKEELGEDRQLQKHKLAGWLKDRYDWIGILEEPQISLHVLQRRFPRYFGNMKGGVHAVHSGDAVNRKDSVTPETMALLKEAMPNDGLVYDVAKELLLQQYKYRT
jgi:hypothetical protein